MIVAWSGNGRTRRRGKGIRPVGYGLIVWPMARLVDGRFLSFLLPGNPRSGYGSRVLLLLITPYPNRTVLIRPDPPGPATAHARQPKGGSSRRRAPTPLAEGRCIPRLQIYRMSAQTDRLLVWRSVRCDAPGLNARATLWG
jgi:hypothetical protein